MNNEVRSPIHRGECAKCNAMRDLVSLDGENWCLNCLLEKEEILKTRSKAGEDVSYELERVRDAIWILKQGREKANYV